MAGRPQRPRTLTRLRLLGDRLALDFANTVDPRVGNNRTECLREYASVLEWGARVGLLTAVRARRLSRRALRDRRGAQQALGRALNLREAIYRVFAAIADGRQVDELDLDVLSSAYRDALAHAAIYQAGRRFHWRLNDALDLIRWQVARDAVALLESNLLDRVKRCPGTGDCGWLFLDTSKNASRRWCSMEGCGNRAKMRRYTRRHKTRHAPSSSVQSLDSPT